MHRRGGPRDAAWRRALIYAPASCAFGAPNFPPAEAIAPHLRGRDVEVVLELVDYDRAPDENGMAMSLKCPLHLKRKEAGNRLFGMGALREAIAKWELAENTLPSGNSLRYDLSKGNPPPSEEEIEERKAACEKVQLSCRLNLASVSSSSTSRSTQERGEALDIDPESVKGLFRRGQARLRIPPVDVEVVRADLLAAAKLDPRNKDIRDELARLKTVNAQQKREERSFYGGMFAKAEPPSKWAAPAPAVPKKKLDGFASTAFGSRTS